MSCTQADRLVQSLLTQAPGTTEAVVRLQLFNVMDEFFRRTSAWRYQTEVALDAGVQEYDYSVPVGSTLVRMMGVSYNDLPVPAAAQPGASFTTVGRLSADLTFPDGDSLFNPEQSDVAGGIFTYSIFRPQYITISVPPSEEQAKIPLQMVMALTVHKDCLEADCGDWVLEDWVWDMFFQDILDGTLSRLFSMPNKPWSSEKLYIYHGKRFRVAMALRKQEANRGFIYAIPGFRFPKAGGWV